MNRNFYRTMVGTEDFCVDACTFQLRLQAFGSQKVIDTPSGILLAGLEAV